MSFVNYVCPRRSLPHSASYSSYFFDERNLPLSLPTTIRSNPRSHPMGDLGGHLRNQACLVQKEEGLESAPARRRIPIACARCRKRKIRCSGDAGNGARCTNCRQAGVDPVQCQFHRVGSENAQKVIDDVRAQSNTRTANSPIYSNNCSLYPPPVSIPQYSLLETKPPYHSTWSIQYPDDNAHVEAYHLDQSPTYLPHRETVTNPQACESPGKWDLLQTVKTPNDETNVCFPSESSYTSQGLHGLRPYQVETTEAPSTLNTAPLQFTLPLRSHGRKMAISDSDPPPRQLPVPQPSQPQASRNVGDQLQDQRLRSVQGAGSSTRQTNDYFNKPKFPRRIYRECQTKVPEASSVTAFPVTLGNGISITTSTPKSIKLTDTASQLEFNFNPSKLMDPVTIPAPGTPYSSFRESSYKPHFITQLTRQNSHPDLCSVNSEALGRHDSMYGESAMDSALVSCQRYPPPKHSPSQLSSLESLHQESIEAQNAPLQRISAPGSRNDL